ncbi:MAG: hypothetical protein WCA20_08650 [Candidatus Sulfotelmatobacter sp.]
MKLRSSNLLLLLLGLAMFMPAVCHAQAMCPWINVATVRGIVGGAVTATVKISEHGFGICNFSGQQRAAVHELRISVNFMTDVPKQFPIYLAQCPPKSTPLPAIGNEAVMCSIQGKGEEYAEIVVGRVRDRAFVVSVSSSIQNDPSMTQETRRERASLVAEQVAGILF